MALSRNEILTLQDISTKELTIPKDIPVWAGKKIYIRQLTRGQQDEYLKRQMGSAKMKQDRTAKNQEISAMNIYGHDAWLCVHGVCDAEGNPVFKATDIDALNKKSGEAIGWIGNEITEFSGMGADVDVFKEDEVKN